MTGIPPTLMASADKFLATATNLIKLIEKNIDSGFRIAKKVRLQRDLARLRRIIELFPQLMYFNGVFVTRFLESVDAADTFSAKRDNPVLLEFEETLDELEQTFDKEAPRLRGLGADMVILFKDGIALRRKILSDYLEGKLDTVSPEDIEAAREKFQEVYPLEHHLWELEKKLEKKTR